MIGDVMVEGIDEVIVEVEVLVVVVVVVVVVVLAAFAVVEPLQTDMVSTER